VVDILADDHGELQAYQQAFNSYRTLEARLEQTRRDIEKARENEDFLRFQYNELLDAALAPGQQEELEAESEMLSHAEDIKGALYEAARLLDGNGDGIVEKLREATRALYNINNVYPDIAEAAARMESCHIELVDLAREVGAKAEKMDFDPRRLEEIDERLNKIYSLEKKHRVDTVEQLIALRDDMEARLDTIDNSDENLRQLEQQVAEMRQQCKETAGVLTAKRRSAATTIEQEMTRRLVPLGIPNVRFEVAITPKPIANDGADKVVFLFSANTSTSLQPVSEVASGGEIARVMLALKAMISGAVKLPTIIFDEIDTGVSGKIAEKMALIMKEMGQAERQVISITHLPQIAAMGAAHYKVEKQETPHGTTSTMYRLSAAQREVEIAQMLSGSTVTEAAMSNARELLRQSS
jgi:DNA repair protein RecN (Recombination protein N)